MQHPRRWLLAGLVAGALPAGCSDAPSTFAGSCSTDGRVSVGDGPPRAGAVVVSVRKSRNDDKGRPIHARPGGALLKIGGVLPLAVDALEEGGDAFLLTFVVPAEVVRELRADPRPFGAELFVPIDLSVPSFTGVDRLVPARVRGRHPHSSRWRSRAIGSRWTRKAARRRSMPRRRAA